MINIEALTRLRDLMLEVDGNEEYKKHFNMKLLHGYINHRGNLLKRDIFNQGIPSTVEVLLDRPGYTTCAIGWATMNPWFKEQGLGQRKNLIDILSINKEWFEDIFYIDKGYYSAKHVANKIDKYLHMIEKGE